MKFRKYMEAMSRLSLDSESEALGKESETPRSDGLLPHQRSGPAKRCTATQALEPQPPKKLCDNDNIHQETVLQDNSAPSTNVETNAEKQPDAYHMSLEPNQKGQNHNGLRSSDGQYSSSDLQLIHPETEKCQLHLSIQENQQKSLPPRAAVTEKLPGIVSGLETSRWAPKNNNSTPINKIDESSVTALMPINNQQQSTVEKQVVASLIQNTNMKAQHLSAENRASAERGTAALDDLKPEKQEGPGELNGVRTRTTPPHLRTFKKPLEAGTKGATTNAQPEETRVNKQDCEGTVLDSRGNWPTEVYAPKMENRTMENRNGDKNSQPQERSSNEISSSTGPKAVPPHLANYIECWARETHEANADFPSHDIDEHGDGDFNANEGDLGRPVNHPKIQSGKPNIFYNNLTYDATNIVV